jgi:phosphoglycerate dehydrogenase-like enzyme
MGFDVICLRPAADFERVGAPPPQTFSITYRSPDAPELPALLKSARVLVIPAVGPALPAALFEGSALRLVQVTGAGVDRLDRSALERLGIAVANVPGGSNSAVAEYAVTCAALLLRRYAWASDEIRAGNYEAFRRRMLADNLPTLEGLTAGVVGAGVIGMAVAAGFASAGCRIRYFDPAPRDAAALARLGAQALPLDQLLRTADIVTLHVPLAAETRGLISARELGLMKPTAVLINAARGGIVDERALAQSLTAGTLAGAAVDVYSTEPPGPDNPLLSLTGDAAQRLVLTPHIAGVTRQSFAHLFVEAWRNVERALRGEGPEHRVY